LYKFENFAAFYAEKKKKDDWSKLSLTKFSISLQKFFLMISPRDLWHIPNKKNILSETGSSFFLNVILSVAAV